MKQLLVLLSLFGALPLIGQNPYFVQFHTNSAFYNPASVGTSGKFSANLSHRNQWPESGWQVIKTTSAATQLQLSEKTGLGVLYLNDHWANGMGTHSFKLQSARIMKIKEESFSIGLEIGYNDQYYFGPTTDDVPNSSSPAFTNSYAFTGGFGVQYQGKGINTGLALRNMKFYERGITFFKPDLSANLKYNRQIKKNFKVGIGGLVAYDLSRFEIITSAAGQYKWFLLNLAYRFQSGPTAGIGIEIKKIQLRYSFDYYTQIPTNLLTSNPDLYKTAHELSLNFRWDNTEEDLFPSPLF